VNSCGQAAKCAVTREQQLAAIVPTLAGRRRCAQTHRVTGSFGYTSEKMIAIPSRFPARPARAVSSSFCLLLLAFSSSVAAVDFSDPFVTGAQLPRPPAFVTAGDEPVYAPCPPPPAGTVYGVIEVVDLALCRNPQTREAWSSARVQAAQLGVAQAEWLPSVDGRFTVGRTRSDGQTTRQRGAALNGSWLLFDFGARAANVDSARHLLRAASATLDATVHGVFLDALQSYYQAQAARAAVTAAVDAERASRESLAAAELRYRVGVATPADRLQAQTALSQATLTRQRAEGVWRIALGRLAQTMGLDADQPLRLDDLPPPFPEAAFDRDVAALIAEARRLRPELQAAEASLQAAQSTEAATRAAHWPSLSVSGGPSWQSSGDLSSHGNSIGLTFNIPLFTGFGQTYNVRAAQARREVQAARRDGVHLQVAFEVWQAYQNLSTASQTLRSSADLLQSAEQSERVALGRYKAGVGTILDVLNAQSALANGRLQRIQAMLDWQVSRATLAKAVGTLDARLLDSGRKTRTP